MPIALMQPKVVGAALGQIVDTLYSSGVSLDEAVNEFRKRWLRLALRDTHGNRFRAAEMVGVHRNTFNRWTHDLGLDREIRANKFRQSQSLPASRRREGTSVPNSVRKGGRGESPEPSIVTYRSSGAIDETPVPSGQGTLARPCPGAGDILRRFAASEPRAEILSEVEGASCGRLTEDTE